MPNTPPFALPLLTVAQAQKEVMHNEALTMLDALVQGTVDAGPQPDPPVAPNPGQCWIVGHEPSGAWELRAGALALWTDGGWRFLAPRAGMRLTRLSDGARLRFDANGWIEPQMLPSPTGGANIDAEARAAIAALARALEAHGLIIYE